MTIQRVIGIVVLIVGVVLLVIGINATSSVADRWSNFFTGHFTDSTMWYMAIGIVAAVVGIGLLLMGGRRLAG